MMDLYLFTFLPAMFVGLITWLLSVYLKDVSIVDSAWPLMFLAGAIYLSFNVSSYDLRTQIILGMVLIWSMHHDASLACDDAQCWIQSMGCSSHRSLECRLLL